ncbi:hypothetical protein BDV98DRAFT_569012 [Pterulicium gracile]|uniref:Uncharacterized protein n=1 Tax=Pterulicium gracile TaxID=1884261 RepID=A0A5C3QG44_9AGAR|nr:hypothetical protein BDV98DRAFT_569012 [Pterula gracilis]
MDARGRSKEPNSGLLRLHCASRLRKRSCYEGVAGLSLISLFPIFLLRFCFLSLFPSCSVMFCGVPDCSNCLFLFVRSLVCCSIHKGVPIRPGSLSQPLYHLFFGTRQVATLLYFLYSYLSLSFVLWNQSLVLACACPACNRATFSGHSHHEGPHSQDKNTRYWPACYWTYQSS